MLRSTFLLIILLSIFLTGCNFKELPIVKDVIIKNREQMTKDTEKAIKNSPELQELDKVCSQIPLPEDFKFISKGGLDDQAISLSTYYYSKTDFQEAKQLFKSYFDDNGWNPIKVNNSFPKAIKFKNDKFYIAIYYGRMGNDVNYSISCEEITSFTKF